MTCFQGNEKNIKNVIFYFFQNIHLVRKATDEEQSNEKLLEISNSRISKMIRTVTCGNLSGIFQIQNENINMVVEDYLDEKNSSNSSNDDHDLEAGTKFDAIQGNLLRGIDNKTVRR